MLAGIVRAVLGARSFGGWHRVRDLRGWLERTVVAAYSVVRSFDL